jgi:two-component system response regulator DegU
MSQNDDLDLISLVVVDDHPIAREGLCALLMAEPDLQVVGEAGDGLEAIRLVEQLQPDVLVLDLKMPGLDGHEVTRLVSERWPETRTIVLSMHRSEAYVLQALKCGASGYVLKGSGVTELIQAIREVVRGRCYLGPPFTERSLELYMQKARGARPESERA